MKTSQQWWNETKQSPAKLLNWLKDQYHGEATAESKIRELADRFAKDRTDVYRILHVIADQEKTHASWVADLCRSRNVQPEILKKEERYWQETLPAIEEYQTIEYASGVAAHAEQMRLARIRAIVDDPTSPEDIRKVFKAILPQEEFHAAAFEAIAGQLGMKQSQASHQRGLNALGLIT